MAKKQKCYIYTRVSTELQIDGYSLEAQKERLRSEAKHRKMQVCGEYSDEGKSGKNIAGRPEFKKMLSDIKSGKDDVDYVLVFKLSRFGRNAADTLNSLQFMEDYGVNLLCVEDGIDSAGAAGKLIISVLASVAEIERANISEQTMAGRRQKARDGKWSGGFAPYGYKLVAKEGEKSKVLVINEEEAELVRLIYKLYLQGMEISSVAKWLNDNGYTKNIRQNGSVSLISAAFVKGVLDNPVYCGKIAYGRRKTEKIEGTRNEFHVVKQDKDSYKLYDGQHEAIIDEETFMRVQTKRMKNAFKREKTHSLMYEHILSGIIKCPKCGASMYGVVNRKKKKGSEEFYTDMWYYICKNRKMVSGHLCDYKKHIRQDEINNEVIQLVKYVFGGENDMKKQILKKLGSDDSLNELLKEKERLTKEREKLSSKKSKLLRRIAELDIDDELYDDLMKTYRSSVNEVNEQIATMENQLYQNDLAIENAEGENLSTEVYKRIIDEMLDHIDDMSDVDKKTLMNLLLEKIEIYIEKQKDGRWVKSVQFKIPLNIDGKAIDTLFFDDEEDTEDSLPNEKHLETCVLLSKK
ncbi:MAG TPA: recombinase family protein [Lachnospiraceae bacterium]|nr:recombinase family protein [uncultured Lachnoclostridium sp.]HAU88580.1 recombinase family protein [Lachnospiraceae bacterium]